MKTLDRDAAGRIQYALEDIDPPQDSKHPISLCMKASEPLQKHVILNDKGGNGTLYLGADDTFQIASFPSVMSDFQRGTASLHGLLGTNASQNAPFKLDGERLVDAIILEEHNASVPPALNPISVGAEDNISLCVP